MSDYIKREDAIEIIARHDDTDGTIKVFSGRFVNGLISAIPPADVRENVRGEWIRRDSRYVGWISFDCSVCGETLELDRETSNDFKYCPFCGAEMREVNYELETRTID